MAMVSCRWYTRVEYGIGRLPLLQGFEVWALFSRWRMYTLSRSICVHVFKYVKYRYRYRLIDVDVDIQSIMHVYTHAYIYIYTHICKCL